MLDFCKRNDGKEIYVYGYFERGIQIYNYLMDNNINVKGFIVSDKINRKDNVDSPIFYLGEVQNNNVAIILALSPRHYNDVVTNIVKSGITDFYFVNGNDLKQSQKCNTFYAKPNSDINKLYWDKEISYKSSKKVFMYLFENLNFSVQSIVDFGCGSGAWLKGAKDLNENIKIMGLDGSDVNRSEFLNENEFIQCDLTSYKLEERYDLAMSLEVAEHLDEKYAEGFVESLCNAADVVLFSAAIKNQGGDHHVNEQYPSYWKGIFEKNNYKCIDCVRPFLWEDRDVPFTFKQNMFLYVKENIYEGIKNRFNTTMGSFSVVHPELLEMKLREVYG